MIELASNILGKDINLSCIQAIEQFDGSWKVFAHGDDCIFLFKAWDEDSVEEGLEKLEVPEVDVYYCKYSEGLA